MENIKHVKYYFKKVFFKKSVNKQANKNIKNTFSLYFYTLFNIYLCDFP